ncbi:MAG TPA: dihydroorotate dehydrogenase, partial [Acidimicrobiales bacterium]|nr:dihydroorotate dehydrogenase [Acidimicrobiales bacterium]
MKRRRVGGVDLAVRVGRVALSNPLMTAAGTAGHGAELARYLDLSTLGAVVVKSLSAEPWKGNPAPRVHEVRGGMLNSVGLQNPGVEAWRDTELPALLDAGATVVA